MRPITLILLAMLAMLAGNCRAGDTLALPDFRNYPQTAGFKRFVGIQTNAAWHLQRSNMLAICAFYDRDDTALQYWITEVGDAFDVRTDPQAHRGQRNRQITNSDLDKLRWAIRELPVTNSTPPLNRLVIVSFRQGTNWLTRTYDRQALPPAMRLIYGIIGERSETKDIGKDIRSESKGGL